MSYLLTGGAGYIGSHTAVELLSSGYDVIIADDLSNSDAQIVKYLEVITGKAPKFYKIDVADKPELTKVFEENDIAGVVHFAGFKAVGESVEKPISYYRNNLDTTLTLLECMAEFNVTNIVFSSSATVYGDSEDTPFVESAPTGGCSSPYGWTKFMVERILTDAASANCEMSVMLLRYFNPIGAHESGLIGEKPNGIPNNLMPYITQVASGILEKLSIFGDDYPTPDGTGVRDYIHVSDLAKGHVTALAYCEKHKGTEVINLGSGSGYSVLDIVKTFERTNGIAVPYTIALRRAGDIAMFYADTAKAKALLGWTAQKSLEDMCRDSWRFQQCCNK